MAILDFNKALSQQEAEARAKAGHLDAEDIKGQLTACAREFVEWMFSGRAYCTAREARIGDVDGNPGASLSIALTGSRAGLWHDHATGESGDLIALYMAYRGFSDGRNFQLALKEIAADFLKMPVPVERRGYQPSAQEWIAHKREKLGDKPRSDLTELGAPVNTWRYLDTRGNVIASVYRYEPDGTPESKTYRPWCHKTINGELKWVPGAPDMRPLYRLPEIATAPEVVLVEGEKCADALAALGIEATTAMQGCKAPIDKTDWSPLNRKIVTIWPDADEGGTEYARKAAVRLSALGCTVRVVTPPPGKKSGWDVADLIAEGGDPVAYLRDAVLFEKVSKPESSFCLYTLEELENLPPPSWIVDGVLPENGLSMLWAGSDAFKTFVAIDLNMSIATGHPWHGRNVKSGLVVYIAAEDAAGVTARLIGWRETRGKELPCAKLRIFKDGLTLVEDAERLADLISALDEEPVLITIDTMARTFGAGNENQTQDMNIYIKAVDCLRRVTKAAVMIIHHTGRNEEKERGNLALRAACDTIISVKRTNDKIKLINQPPYGKQKNAEPFQEIQLRMQKLHYQFKGEERSTLIVMPDDSSPVRGDAQNEQSAQPAQRLGQIEKSILAVLAKAARDGRGLGFVSLLAAAQANNRSGQPLDKGSFGRALRALVGHGFMRKDEDERTYVLTTEGANTISS